MVAEATLLDWYCSSQVPRTTAGCELRRRRLYRLYPHINAARQTRLRTHAWMSLPRRTILACKIGCVSCVSVSLTTRTTDVHSHVDVNQHKQTNALRNRIEWSRCGSTWTIVWWPLTYYVHIMDKKSRLMRFGIVYGTSLSTTWASFIWSIECASELGCSSTFWFWWLFRIGIVMNSNIVQTQKIMLSMCTSQNISLYFVQKFQLSILKCATTRVWNYYAYSYELIAKIYIYTIVFKCVVPIRIEQL